MHAFFLQMHLFFLTLDMIDILCLFYSNFWVYETIFEVHKRSFMDLKYYFICTESLVNKSWNINCIQSQENQLICASQYPF